MCNLIYNIYIGGFFFTSTVNELFDNVLKNGVSMCDNKVKKKKKHFKQCFVFKIISL